MAWVALGVGQLIAGIGRPQGSPVAAVGGAAIDGAPPAVKNFAISAFGPHDKLVLVLGILVVLAVFSAAIGIAATRRLRNGYIGLAIFTVVGLAAALTRPDAELVERAAHPDRRAGRGVHAVAAGPGGRPPLTAPAHPRRGGPVGAAAPGPAPERPATGRRPA